MDNIERDNLMYFVALPEVFGEYGVTEQGTQLESGKVFIHASKCGIMAVRYNGDKRVLGFDKEGMKFYLQNVDNYLGYTEEV